MQRQRMLLTAVVAAMMAVPISAATWTSHGSYEPDTLLDVQGGYMYENPDVNPDESVKKVYFNAYVSKYVIGGASPNTGTLGGRIRDYPLLFHEALLGVWKDCNKDGYVGYHETSAVVYSAALLPPPTPGVPEVCPADPGNSLAHNDGQWVYEFIYIGPVWNSTSTQPVYNATGLDNECPGSPDGCVSYDGTDVNQTGDNNLAGDSLAFVWMDFGLPGAPVGQTCPLAPLPHGTTANSGRLIRYVDCLVNQRLTNAVNTVDPDGALGLKFQCPEEMTEQDCQNNPQESNSTLVMDLPESLFGNPGKRNDEGNETGTLQREPENEGEVAWKTWDCDREIPVNDEAGLLPEYVSTNDATTDGNNTTEDTLNVTLKDENGTIFVFPQPDPQVGDPRHSVSASLEETEGACGASAYAVVHDEAFFYADGAHEGTTQAPGKNAQNLGMTYFHGGDQVGFGAIDDGNETDDTAPEDEFHRQVANVTGPRTPDEGGVHHGTWFFREGWSADVIYVIRTPQSLSDATLEPHPALYSTFYAYVAPKILEAYGLSVAAGTRTETYGSENCPVVGPGAPIGNTWICDPAAWYLDSNNEDIRADHERKVGHKYNLRDVDCFDGTIVRGVPVYASLVMQHTDDDGNPTGPCKDAPVSVGP